MNQQE